MINNDPEEKILKLFGSDFRFYSLDISFGSKYIEVKES